MKRVIVDSNYTYETDLPVKKGNRVLIPTPYWLQDVKGPTWEGTVTSLKSSYNGFCERIIEIVS